MAFNWYIVHTYSGFEKQGEAFSGRESGHFWYAGLFCRHTDTGGGCGRAQKGREEDFEEKFFPGYILVNMELNDDTWHVVKDTPKVTGFIGMRDRPSPVSDESVRLLKTRIDEGTLKPSPKFKFEFGDHVRIVDGPFTNFDGVVDEVKPEKGKLRVIVSIFGRSTPVELDFIQVVQS